MRQWLGTGLATVALLAVGGCSKAPGNLSGVAKERLNTFDVASVEEIADAGAPQVAYTYGLSYALDSDRIAAVQARHVAACRRLGPARCMVVKTDLTRQSGDAAATQAETDLLIDARLAGSFGQALDRSAADAGGSLTGRHVTAEDVTKQLVDTGARVRAKQALADRLMALIAHANGKVGDLVAAEKAFADTQEELDAARSLQAALRQRVAMSAVNIDYAATAATGSWAPVRRSLADVGATLAASIAGLVTALVAALPWVMLLALLVWLRRRLGWRWPWRRRGARAAPDPI